MKRMMMETETEVMWPDTKEHLLLATSRSEKDARKVKNPLANAGDVRDTGSIPGLGRSLEEGMATHSSILARSP